MTDKTSTVTTVGSELSNRYVPLSATVVEITPAGRFALSVDNALDKSLSRGWTARALDDAWTVSADA